MITYVNTVLVSNNAALFEPTQAKPFPANPADAYTPSTDAGKLIFMNCDAAEADGSPFEDEDLYALTATCEKFKIGMITNKVAAIHDNATGNVSYKPVIKWSNEIRTADIKCLSKQTYKADTEDSIEIDLTTTDTDVKDAFAAGGKRICVRLTFKDLPTRYRNWTESYDYITVPGDTPATIATAIASTINKQWKRARVIATANSGKVTLVAMKYDDDNSVDSINPAAKVRFNASIYYQDPTAAAFASSNKYPVLGVKITKIPGIQYPASAKLVRDREAQAMGYDGILNRGEGTWPIIKPDMNTVLSNKYDGIVLEFENMYRAADDIFRKTKQTVEIYGATDGTNHPLFDTSSEVGSEHSSVLAKLVALTGVNNGANTAIDNSAAYDSSNYDKD